MKRATVAGIALSASVVGCAHALPPQELVDARSTYKSAAAGPASKLEADKLVAAKKELARAESVFASHGDGLPTRDAAYLAIRKAQLADAAAKTAVAVQEREPAEQVAVVAQANAFEETRTELTTTQAELEHSQKARVGAEKCERQAFEELQRVAWVKREDRGVVITLSGSVAFRKDQHTLEPASFARLERVASALTRASPDATVVVEGYTDAGGSVERNKELSLARAEAVAGFLAAHGVARSRITAMGLGPERPIGDNHTLEGRAQNRRVEIVVTGQD